MSDIRFVGQVLIGIPRSQMNMAHDDTIMITINTANSGHRVSTVPSAQIVMEKIMLSTRPY